MISLADCTKLAGLPARKLLLGVSPSPRHRRLLDGYLLSLDLGAATVQRLIIADIQSFLDLGLTARAADSLVALRLFLEDYPETRVEPLPPRPSSASQAGAIILPFAALKQRRRRLASV